MFKLLVLSAVLAVAAAAPSGVVAYDHHPISYESVVAVQPELHLGHVVEHVPTAVSHQSRTDYHSKPVLHSYVAAPVVHAPSYVHHASPIVHAAPVYSSAHSVAYTAPLVHSAGPLVHSW